MQVLSVLGSMAVPLPRSLAVFLALPLLVSAVHTGHGAAASTEGDDLLKAIQRRGDLPEMVRLQAHACHCCLFACTNNLYMRLLRHRSLVSCWNGCMLHQRSARLSVTRS